MRSSSEIRTRVVLIGALALFAAAPSFAANYPLELINIRSGMDPNNRILRAYPGVEYNIRAAVIGGAYPFTFSLSNAPAGMTIDSRSGLVVWPNPQASATPTIRVTDSEGTTVAASWTITVTTDGFRFVDAVNGRNAANNGCSSGCGNGSSSNPWRTISDMYYNAQATDFVYFRSGRYFVTDLPRVGAGGAWERIEFADYRNPSVWLAAPGHNPIIDFANGPLIRLRGNTVYIDGFETTNSRYIGFQYSSLGGIGPTFRRLRMHTSGPGLDGSNAAMILLNVFDAPTNYTVIQDSEFFDINYGTGNCALKIYSQAKILIESNYFHHTDNGAEAVVALKQDIRQFTVRSNVFNIPGKAIGGNLSSYQNAETRTTHGEILFNNVIAGMFAIDLNQNSQAAQIYVYRNTLVGPVRVREADANDGPFTFTRNVIVNNDAGTPSGSHISHYYVTDPSRIVAVQNLAGYPSDNIVDSSGNLTSGYASYVGNTGHMVGPAPAPPSNLRIIR